MANDLYDTGGPKRIIVEHHHSHDVQVRPSWCDIEPRVQCIGSPHATGGPCAECPFDQRGNPSVTIAPQFEVVQEPKKLKRGAED